DDASDVSFLPIGFRAVRPAVVTGHTTGLHAVRDGEAQGRAALEIFETIEGLVGLLPQLPERLLLERIFSAAGFLAPREWIVAVKSHNSAGSHPVDPFTQFHR